MQYFVNWKGRSGIRPPTEIFMKAKFRSRIAFVGMNFDRIYDHVGDHKRSGTGSSQENFVDHKFDAFAFFLASHGKAFGPEKSQNRKFQSGR